MVIELRKGIMDKIDQELGSPEFSRRNIEKLEQFNDPKVVEEFQLLPFRIMDEVSRKKVITVEDATLVQAAVAMELLLATMVRRKNLANTDLKTNFWPAKPRLTVPGRFASRPRTSRTTRTRLQARQADDAPD